MDTEGNSAAAAAAFAVAVRNVRRSRCVVTGEGVPFAVVEVVFVFMAGLVEVMGVSSLIVSSRTHEHFFDDDA
jgi:hypothetical protein